MSVHNGFLRLVVGHCPACGMPIAITNDGETWPLAKCKCGWVGATTELLNRVRLERTGVIKVSLSAVANAEIVE